MFLADDLTIEPSFRISLDEFYSIKEGSLIEFEFGKTKIFGTILPSNDDTLMIKQHSGYNSGFNTEQKPLFIKNRNNIFLVYESLHKCKILSNDIEIYPDMIYFKYKENCTYKESYKPKEVHVPIIVDNGNISINDQLTNITIPLFYDIVTKIYKVQYFDFQFQNEIKTYVNNFIVMCNKYITTQEVYHPKQYYLNRTKKKKN
jgi:hypothetical protein